MREPTFVRLNPSEMGLKGKTCLHGERLSLFLQKAVEKVISLFPYVCCLCVCPVRSEAVLQAGAVPIVTSQGFRREGAALTGAVQ